MKCLNKVMLIGHLASDPELRQTQGGQQVSNFPVVTNRKWRDPSGELREEANFHRVVVWQKVAESCAKYLKKGSGVYIEGRINNRTFADQTGQTRYYTEIIADSVNFLRTPKLATE